jgi:hypothetical protein
MAFTIIGYVACFFVGYYGDDIALWCWRKVRH